MTTMNRVALTKDILGEHLFQKIKELDLEWIKDTGVYRNTLLINKVTGILVERSVAVIYRMLTDKSILEENVKKAVASIEEESQSTSGQDAVFTVSETGNCEAKASRDEIGQQLYEKVRQLDPDLAPKITGMLLELDDESVCGLLTDEAMFVTAFDKAKRCLPSDPSTLSEEQISQDIFD